MDTNQYLSLFIDESKEHLQAMNDNMLALENAPEDIGIVQHMFRSAHTLKGMSATMGFTDIASLTHEMENVLDMVRNGKLHMEDFIFDCIFRSLDSLESMVGDIVDGGSGNADVSSIVADLKTIVDGTYQAKSANHQIAATVAEAATATSATNGGTMGGLLDQYQSSVLIQSMESGYNAYQIHVQILPNCVLKAARAYMVFDAVSQLGEIIKSIPSVEDLEADKFGFEFSLVLLSTSNESEIASVVKNVSEIESVKVVPIHADQIMSYEPMAISSVAEAEVTTSTPGRDKIAAEHNPDSIPVTKPSVTRGAPSPTRTIRVDTEKLDMLMNLFSELLIDRVRIEQLASEVKRADLIETVEHMGRVSSDLQNVVMKLRMMPVETVFNRFPRMIRDIAKNLNKKVELIISGAETELDRTVIEEIGDPLVHLLRNSVDHGIESVDDRIRAGKSETGTVYLRAYHSGNHVFIEVEEDGRGIQRDVVLKKAIKNGLLTKEQGEGMSDEEVFQLLFAAGFSTAEIISDISGRGVGLDVVKTKISSLGGHVHVSSNPGHGTKFSIQLPLTLSIIMAMIIQLGKEKYAIPLSSIVETSIIRKESIKLVHGNKFMEFRSSIIPLLSLSKLYEVSDYSEEFEAETEIVVVRKGDKLAGIMVDELLGQQEIVLKSLGTYLSNVFAVSGATILGDGQVALIIDTNALIR